MMSPRIWKSAVFAVVLALVATGCSFTTTETARQLDHGEQVYSGSADFPGFLYLPRLNVAGKFGLGGAGDLGAHVGTNFMTYNAGVAGRVYPGDYAIIGLQTNTMFFPAGTEIMGTDVGGDNLLTTITPRVMTAVQEDGPPVYGGMQSTIFISFGEDVDGVEYDFAAIGPLFGFDHVTDSNIGIQIELILMPIGIGPEGEFAAFGQGEEAFMPFQISLGGYFRHKME